MERLHAGHLNETDLKFVRDEFPGMTNACVEKVRADGIDGMPNRTDECFEMMPSQRWSGLWRNDLEGAVFCPDAPGKPVTKCPAAVPAIWFGPDGYEPDGGLYRVEFIGRRTVHAGKFGAYGAFPFEVVLDRMISKKLVERPSKD